MKLNERIREIRIKRGLTQREVGERAHIAEPTIRKYESGKLNPKITTLEKIASALDVPVLALMGYIFIGYAEDETPIYGPPPTTVVDIGNSYPQFDGVEIHDLSKSRKQPIIRHDSYEKIFSTTVKQSDVLTPAEHQVISAYRVASKADRGIIDNIVERYVSDSVSGSDRTSSFNSLEHQKTPTPVSEDGLDDTEKLLTLCTENMDPAQKQMFLEHWHKLSKQRKESSTASDPLATDGKSPESERPDWS